MLKTITRQLFARLNRHLPYRLVHRDPLPGAQTAVNATIPPSLSERCLKVAAMEQETLWRVFDTHPEGLNAAEVTRAREKHGENRLPAQETLAVVGASVGMLSQSFQHLTHDSWRHFLCHGGSVCRRRYRPDGRYLNAAEFCAGSALDESGGRAKSDGEQYATVLRVINENGENAWLELPIDQLVPGDIIKLAAGDMIRRFTDYPGARSVCRPGVADRRISAGRESRRDA
ncbi:magnesium-transporting ATPase MgtA [Salmonella enterica subsp. enterica]|uniref:Magnesium-transporting ATPase MgtA n=1 Tax=Salmonella enterica I TaxID=59201 RepID=A0A3S4FSU1_SALET|nr:magnesium-transporting ATPase MgtA [Salmonella enterica subsp. enterica]